MNNRPMGGNGSSCAGCHGRMTRSTVQALGSYAQSGFWFGGGTPRTS